MTVNLMTEMTTMGLYSVNTLEKEMIHIPGRTEPEGTRFHHATQNSAQFKTYCLFLEFSM